MKRWLCCMIASLLAVSTFAAEHGKRWNFDAAKLKPFWRSNTMDGESVLFIRDEAAESPRAAVLFLPTKILSLCSSSGEIVYVAGRDYVWKPGTREIVLPAGSRIPFQTPQGLRRPPRSQPFVLPHRDGKGEIFFGGGHGYHDMQTLVSYEHAPDAWAGPVPTFAGSTTAADVGKARRETAACASRCSAIAFPPAATPRAGPTWPLSSRPFKTFGDEPAGHLRRRDSDQQ